MHRTKTLAYLLSRDFRTFINGRVAKLKAQRQAAMNDDSQRSEDDYQDATSRLLELGHMVNTMANNEDNHRVRLQTEFNENFTECERGKIDRSNPERFDVFSSEPMYEGHPRG